jgi:hypothetical protein
MILIRQWNNVDTRTELVFYCSIQFGLLQLSSSNHAKKKVCFMVPCQLWIYIKATISSRSQLTWFILLTGKDVLVSVHKHIWETQCFQFLFLNIDLTWYNIIVSNVIISKEYSLYRAVVVVIVGSWIYNYLWNQSLLPLTLWFRIPLMARCTWYNIMWSSLSVTCGKSVVFSGYSGFL